MSHNVEHKVIVTGAPPASASGDVQPKPYIRLPIEELIKDKKQFALYVQAIDMLMKKDPGDMLSWFQISGIHGDPVQPWDNVRGDADSESGYCTHFSVLFPTWHRPYVLLFEQALVGCAVTIAERYKGDDADDWKRAAISLRSPYWDWARNSIPPPEVIQYQKLIVPGPDGDDITLDPNPLLGYRYQEGAPQVDLRSQIQTVRCPKSRTPNVSDLDDLKKALRLLEATKFGDSMRKSVWETLTHAKTWEAFSNKGSPGDSSHNTVNSLEALHGTIHALVGGAGQMASINLSAFDPIFWLHHTNVDRLLALWQALHPNVWVSGGPASSFTIQAGSRVDENTDLTPFWNGTTTFFKSSSPGVREWQLLNYDYPEFVDIAGDTDTRRVAISAAVNNLYGENTMRADVQLKRVNAPLSSIVAEPSARVPIAVTSSDEESAAPAAGKGEDSQAELMRTDANEETQLLDWFARIRVQANKVGSSFSVLLFVGPPPEHEHDWRTADNLIGIHGEFVNSRPDQCANCRENMESLTEGFIGLTRVLNARGWYGGRVDDIEAYLSKDLEWRVQKTDATIVPPSEVPGLEIAVMTVPLEFSEEWQEWIKGDELPTPRKVTRGRAGGCSLPLEE